MALNQTQSSELTRTLALKSLFLIPANVSIYTGYSPLNRAILSLIANSDKLEAYAQNKGRTPGLSELQDLHKRNIAKDFGQVLSHTQDYATLKGDNELLALVDFSESTIYKTNNPDLLSFILNIKNKVFTTALLDDADFKEYEITLEDLTAIVAEATEFNDNIGGHKVENTSSSVVNDAINAIIVDVHKDLTSIDRNIGKFEEEYSDFVNAYKKNKILIVEGVRHQGIKGYLYIDGVKQPHGSVHILDTKKQTEADADAYYELIGVRAGKYRVKGMNADGKSQIKDIVIRRRRIDDVDFNLE